MSLRNEIEVYEKAKISPDTGDIDIWDKVIFPNVIRKREIKLIFDLVNEIKPERILDFGCGTGWLSKVLSSNGYHTVGIDVSSWLIKNAVKSSYNKASPSFMVGDCMNLPFRGSTFDLILGIGILHHLNSDKALVELQRVATENAALLLMEPNRLNPISTLGNKICPPDTHTKGEHPFSPSELRKAFSGQGWVVSNFSYLFPYSFGLAYLLNKTGWRDNQSLKPICLPIEKSERFLEKVPFLNCLSWTILVVARKL